RTASPTTAVMRPCVTMGSDDHCPSGLMRGPWHGEIPTSDLAEPLPSMPHEHCGHYIGDPREKNPLSLASAGHVWAHERAPAAVRAIVFRYDAVRYGIRDRKRARDNTWCRFAVASLCEEYDTIRRDTVRYDTVRLPSSRKGTL